MKKQKAANLVAPRTIAPVLLEMSLHELTQTDMVWPIISPSHSETKQGRCTDTTPGKGDGFHVAPQVLA